MLRFGRSLQHTSRGLSPQLHVCWRSDTQISLLTCYWSKEIPWMFYCYVLRAPAARWLTQNCYRAAVRLQVSNLLMGFKYMYLWCHSMDSGQEWDPWDAAIGQNRAERPAWRLLSVLTSARYKFGFVCPQGVVEKKIRMGPKTNSWLFYAMCKLANWVLAFWNVSFHRDSQIQMWGGGWGIDMKPRSNSIAECYLILDW